MNSSFTINLRGERNQLIADLANLTATPPNAPQDQINDVKAMLQKRVAALPAKFNGAMISAHGSVTGDEVDQSNYSVIGQNFSLPGQPQTQPPKSVPAPAPPEKPAA